MADLKCERCDIQLKVGKVCDDPLTCVKNLRNTIVKLNHSVSFWKDGWYEQRTATANNFVNGFNEALAQCRPFIIKVLSLFGQMNRERNEDGTQVLKMRASDRADLIDEGYKSIKTNRWNNGFANLSDKPCLALDIIRLNALLELDKKPANNGKVFPTSICILERDDSNSYYLSSREECEKLVVSLGIVKERLHNEWINVGRPSSRRWEQFSTMIKDNDQ